MTESDLRRVYHIARVDFVERVQSRRLLIFLVGVAYLGYLINVSFIKMSYIVDRVHVVGEPTAPLVGLQTALVGGLVVMFGGFYFMRSAIQRDRKHGHGALVASTGTADAVYLLGKLTSNTALGGVVAGVLGLAALINHAIHGVGPTNVLALLTPLIVLTLPLCVLVGAVALLFETVSWFDGTLGTVVHLVFAFGVLSGVFGVGEVLPSELSTSARLVDIVGFMPVYQMTFDALSAAAPDYAGGPPGLATFPDRERPFSYGGAAWPLWVFPQRLAVVLAGVGLTLLGTVSFDRFRSSDRESTGFVDVFPSLAGLFSGVRERLRGDGLAGDDETRPVESIDTTPVTTRDNGGFLRLLAAELRLGLREHRWWWYVGVVALIVVPLRTFDSVALGEPQFRFLVALVVVWPMPVWREIGSRSYRHGLEELLFSSQYPRRQLFAEWAVGVIVGGVTAAGVVSLAATVGNTTLLVGLLAGAVFPPSLAAFIGVWLRSERGFEAMYFLLWYAGPINGLPPADFVATRPSTGAVVPAAFVVGGLVAVGAALVYRSRETA
jgi:hypothetical protein